VARRDQHDVKVRARRDLAEVHREAVRKQQRRALIDVIDNTVIKRFLDHIRSQKCHDRRTFYRFVGRLHVKPVCRGLLPAGAVRPQPDNDVDATVPEVECVRASLAAIAEDRDLLTIEARGVDVGF
jgi:hypothetical protein